MPGEVHDVGLTVAADWFAFQPVGDGVTRIWEPHVHDLMQANMWHVRGREADLLVDAGMGAGDLSAALAARGLAGERPLLLVVTHCHADHAGGAHQFWPRAVHVAEASLLAAPSRWRPLVVADYPSEFQCFFVLSALDEATDAGAVLGAQEAMAADAEEPVGAEAAPHGAEQPAVDSEGAAAGAHGVADDAEDAVADLVVDAVPSPDFDPWSHTLRPATPTLQVREGEVFDLGDRELQVLHLPGHSPGSIGLWDERAGVLFAGDVVYDVGALLDELEESSIPDYCATMRRLRELPVRTVLAGHGEPFGRDLLQQRVAGYLKRREKRVSD